MRLLAETFFDVMSHPGAWNPAPLLWAPWDVRPTLHVSGIQVPPLVSMEQWKNSSQQSGDEYLSPLFCLTFGISIISHMKCRGCIRVRISN